MHGLDEVVRDFRKIDRSLARELQGELKKAAEPVKEEAEQRLTRFSAKTQRSVRIRASGASVRVEHTARKTTGTRPDHGQRVQTRYEEALTAREREVIRRLEKFVDGLADGFNHGGRL